MAEFAERYNVRVDFQSDLDEQFPRGAYYAEVIAREDSTFLPSGITGSVGRLLASDADTDEEGWWYAIMLDFNRREDLDDPANFSHPLEVRVRELVEAETEGLYEAEVIPPSGFVRLARFHSDPAGPRVPPPGHREWLTERWEAELFPSGIEHIDESQVSAEVGELE